MNYYEIENFMNWALGLVVFLILSHFILLYYINSYIKKYKKNNYNFISKELGKLELEFQNRIINLKLKVGEFTRKSGLEFQKLKKANDDFIDTQEKRFKGLTEFIAKDYHSLTEEVMAMNTKLESLLEKTRANITNNKELRPILVDSNKELEKVYSKIKVITTNYEKNLEDIKSEVQDSLKDVEKVLDSKIRKLATEGEKILSDSFENSKNSIEKVTNETNKGLKKVLKDDQIDSLTKSVLKLEKNINNDVRKINGKINDIKKSVSSIENVFKDLQTNSKGKKNGKWW